LENIVQSSRRVLDASRKIKQTIIGSEEVVTVAATGIPAEEVLDQLVVIQPRDLFEHALDLLPSMPSAIRIFQEIDDDVDAIQVAQNSTLDILENLIINAVEAMPEGGQIRLKARNAGRFVALEVIDTGPGIAKEDIPKIFNLFYSTKRSTGFGLWSARTNALKNHGDLKVKSELGQRTTFTLLLPRGVKQI